MRPGGAERAAGPALRTALDLLPHAVQAVVHAGEAGSKVEVLNGVGSVEVAQVVHVELVHRVRVPAVLVLPGVAEGNAKVARHLRGGAGGGRDGIGRGA